MRTAIFPGSFDPLTQGHVDIISRASNMFDKVYAAIGCNSQKKPLFPLEKRQAWLQTVFAQNPSVEIVTYEGLTADFCKRNNIHVIVRGIRNGKDFEYEQQMAMANRVICPDIDTIFLVASPALAHVSSELVREIYRLGGNYDLFLPKEIANL
ncbi:MAG: pantetheine-phosphate adenylyltransferase [Bacteroidales bacterium]|jgi:pantetheine-phosphate adenylyltransferase|nr:pantetheine-phosphate adenylyltransferase [Bacteroidales bacterium]